MILNCQYIAIFRGGSKYEKNYWSLYIFLHSNQNNTTRIFSLLNGFPNLRMNEIWSVIRNMDDLSNKERKFVVLMVLCEAQNHKNNKGFFSYFESLEFGMSGNRRRQKNCC